MKMRLQSREYSLAGLIADPVIGIALKEGGIDRRSLDLLLETLPRAMMSTPGTSRDFSLHAPFVG